MGSSSMPAALEVPTCSITSIHPAEKRGRKINGSMRTKRDDDEALVTSIGT
jgi:hypothetical protein